MTDRTFHRIAAAVWLFFLIALFLLSYRCKAQTVKQALPPQHQTAPHTAPPVRPATACRVVTSTGPVTGWGPCGKDHRTAQRLTAHGSYAWVERKIGKAAQQQ
jgi:hypothetical protein